MWSTGCVWSVEYLSLEDGVEVHCHDKACAINLSNSQSLDQFS